MSIFSKFKRARNKRILDHDMEELSNPRVSIIYSNALVENIYAACTCCYCNLNPNLSYEQKLDYIEKRVKAGHGSVLEHGRMLMKVEIPNNRDAEQQLLDILTNKATMYFNITQYDFDTHKICISSSVRGFKHFVENCDLVKLGYEVNDLEVRIVKAILEYLPDIFFADTMDTLFKGRLLDVFDFNVSRCGGQIPRNNIAKTGIAYELLSENRKDIDVVEYDKGIDVGFDINSYHKIQSSITINKKAEDILSEFPITVVFKGMSRTATHQLVRHRNAITQESQRYVDYSDANFTIPSTLDRTKQYMIKLNGETSGYNLEQLVDVLKGVYPQLVKMGMKKEDARAFLPANMNCGKLYMTFTLGNLFKFIELRTDPHAQAEIRSYAKLVKEFVDNHGIELKLYTESQRNI